MMMFLLLMMLFLSSFSSMMMIMMLISFTFIYVIKLYLFLDTFWYSYIVMMIVMSGVLVLFTYMASLSSNESIDFNKSLLFLFLSLMLYNEENMMEEVMETHSVSIWDQKLMNLNIMILIFLLITMFMVVKLSNFNFGSLRI
uniref:NADH dehydrogenase subunit 6 n=1 Tax=Atypus karschi TaxID=2337319 RepID=A0A8A5YAN5_9ARAC|nr:NADH dehydrogenase subunit 6 [Atypus karschi]QTH31104.1 NADH dehydrogenase subunit 6 [Atypus karschi]